MQNADSQPVHRQVRESHGDVGQVPQKLVQDPASRFAAVPSCTDGWRAENGISGAAAERNERLYCIKS